MPNTFYPTQIGSIPTGNSLALTTSQIFLGRNMTATWEAAGFGYQGRPDYLEVLYIYLTDSAQNPPAKIATLAFNVADVQTIITAHANAAAAALTFQLREVDVCDAGVAKKMMVLASAPYTVP